MSSSAATPESAPSQAPATAPSKKKKTNLLFRLLRMAVMLYAGICLIVFSAQRAIIFSGAGIPWISKGAGVPWITPGARQWPFEEFRLPVDGETTYGWYIPVENARGTVLFSHSNSSNMGDCLNAAGVYRSFGFNVLQYTYGGYGLSTGRPSETRCYDDARAVWKWLAEQKGEVPNRIVLVGRSLGGAMAIQLATEVSPAAVVLEGAFASMGSTIQDKILGFPVSFLLFDKFQNLDKIAKIREPILFFHSPEDTIVHYHRSRRLFEQANEPKTFVTLHGDHGECYFADSKTYEVGLACFLDAVFKQANSTNVTIPGASAAVLRET